MIEAFDLIYLFFNSRNFIRGQPNIVVKTLYPPSMMGCRDSTISFARKWNCKNSTKSIEQHCYNGATPVGR